jgi:hypothetical protein
MKLTPEESFILLIILLFSAFGLWAVLEGFKRLWKKIFYTKARVNEVRIF